MARIPLYTGRGGAPSTQISTGPSVNYSKIRTFDAKGFAAIGSEIENLFNDFNDKRVKTQVANADADAMFQLTQLQEKVKNVDPSQADSMYQQGAQEIYQNLAQNMSNDSLAKFHPTWVKLQAIGRINTFKNGIERGKTLMVADDNAAYEKTIDSLVVDTPAVQYDMAIEQMKKSVNAAVESRAYTDREASTLIASRTDKIRQTQVLNRLNADLTRNPNALEQLKVDLNDPKSFEGLDGDTRARLLKSTQNQIETHEREQKSLAVARSNEAKKNVADELNIRLATDPKKPAKFANLKYIKRNVVKEEQAALIALVNDQETFRATSLPIISSGSLSDIASERERLIQDANNQNLSLELQKQNLKQLQLFEKRVSGANGELNQRQKNSGSVVLRTEPIQKLYGDFKTSLLQGNAADAQERWSAYKSAADVRFDELEILRGDRKYLSVAEAQQMATQITGGGAENAAIQIGSIYNALGRVDGGKLVSKIFTNKSVSRDMQAIGAIANHKERRAVAEFVAKGGIKSVISDTANIDQLKDETLRQFGTKFPNMGVRSNISVGPLRNAVELVAARNIANDMPVSQAVTEAIKTVAPYQVVNNKNLKGIVHAPGNENVVKPRQLERGLVLWLQNQKDLVFDKTVTGSIPQGIKNTDRQKLARQSLVDTGVWRLSGDGMSAVLTDSTGEEAVLDANGKEIRVTVEEAMNVFEDPRMNPGAGGYGSQIREKAYQRSLQILQKRGQIRSEDD